MIDPKKLRIGNYVDYEKTTHVVTGVLDNGKVYSRWVNGDKVDMSYEYVDDAKYYDPIEVTETILVNLGIHAGRIIIDHITEDHLQIMEKRRGKYSYLIDVDKAKKVHVGHFIYVHTLQNLYHSLSEKELTLKINE